MEFRPLGLDDAGWVSDLLTRCRPDDPVDPQVLRHRWATLQTSWWHERSLVAIGGEALGVATASHPPPGLEPERTGRWGLSLLPEATGLADEVIALLEARLRDRGARVLSSGASEDQGWLLGALGRRRYRQVGLKRQWELDLVAHRDQLLADAAERKTRMADQGVRLSTLDQARDGSGIWGRLTTFYAETEADLPHTMPFHPMTEEEVRSELGGPDTPPDRVWLAMVGDEIAGLSHLSYPPVRGHPWTSYTATARAHRGRGIARAVKAESLAQAIELGVQRVRTNNDDRNAPMLHINETLGYVALPSWVVSAFS